MADKKTNNQNLQVSRRTLLWTATGSIAALLALLFAGLGQIYSHLHADLKQDISTAVTGQLREPNGQLASIGSRLAKIEGNLEILEPQIRTIIELQLKKAAALPAKEFQKNLPNLHQTLRAARLKNISSNSQLLSVLSTKLWKSNSQELVFWPTATEFLSYRSESLLPQLARKFGSSSKGIPRCTDKTPSPPAVVAVPGPHTVQIRDSVYENCRVTLDNPEDVARINFFIEKGGTGVEFVDSLIEYHGGEIPIHLFRDAHDPKRAISTLYFTRCIFDFTAADSPPPEAQKVLLDLLLNTVGDLYVYPGAQLRPGLPPWQKNQ